MPRKNVTINKTSEAKIQLCFKKLNLNKEFQLKFYQIIEYDLKNIKECSDKSIIEFYIETLTEMYDEFVNVDDEQFWKDVISLTRKKLVRKYASDKIYGNNIDIYFNEVKNIYIEHPQNECNDLEFIPENRDIFIKNNLKLVIECAKRYRNLGVSFEDLIQIGNIGLIQAFNKFDTDRANLRKAIIKDIKNSEQEKFTKEEAEKIIRKNFVYSKNLDITLNKLPKEGFKDKNDFIEWSKENIKTAIFASVAFQWIRGHILLEISKYGKLINLPKSVQEKYGNTSIIRLDSLNPYTEDCYHDNDMKEYINNEIVFEQELFEDEEHNQRVKDIVEELLISLNCTERRIIKKKFGIGYPFPMSITDIADSEQLSINKIKYILQNSMKILYERANDKVILNNVFSL